MLCVVCLINTYQVLILTYSYLLTYLLTYLQYYFLSSITIPKIPNNFCRLKFLVLHTFSTKLTDICLNHRGQGGHEKLLLTCSGVSPSSRQCFSHVWTAVVYPWETRANIFSCSFTTFSVGEICVFGRFRTFSDVFTL